MVIEMGEDLPILKGILNGVVKYHNAPVRFGRVPKREKARILAAMQQSSSSRAHEQAAAGELDDGPRLLARVVRAHLDTCEFTRDRVAAMRARGQANGAYTEPFLACPLNPLPELQSEKEFSQRFAHVIRGVIDFAGLIPGFTLLTQDDKFTLLKNGLFDALFVRLICLFDPPHNSIVSMDGQLMKRDNLPSSNNGRFLVDSTFKFAERMNSMNLTDAEVGLFCAIVLITPDRPGLRNIDLVERMHSRLEACLRTVIAQNRPDQPGFLRELMDTLPDLRTLSTLHTEKLVVFSTGHRELLRHEMWGEAERVSSPARWPDSGADDSGRSPPGSVSSTESGEATEASEAAEPYGASSAPLLAATLAGVRPGRPIRRRHDSRGSEDEPGPPPPAGLAPVRPPLRYRKLDSPTDSGIESGNEKHERHAGPGSGCSSPRSSLEDHAEERRHAADDMPVLKRVLQAPPLYDASSLMDEAYKPHKKFRAMRRDTAEAEPRSHPSPQPQAVHPGHLIHSALPGHLGLSARPHRPSSLSSTHSVLAKSLMEGPRMTPEQLKRTDMIQQYIRRGEAAAAAAASATAAEACPLRANGLLTCAPYRGWAGSVITAARSPARSPAYSPAAPQSPRSPHAPHAPLAPHSPLSPALSLELQVDVADAADAPQPLNLSKKSPSPAPVALPVARAGGRYLPPLLEA